MGFETLANAPATGRRIQVHDMQVWPRLHAGAHLLLPSKELVTDANNIPHSAVPKNLQLLPGRSLPLKQYPDFRKQAGNLSSPALSDELG
jgi:hypothetical protein